MLLEVLTFSSLLPYAMASWKIDSSCDPWRQMIGAGMNSAFDMADNAWQALQQQPRDPHINAVIKNLFMKDDGDPNTFKTSWLLNTYGGIRDNRQEGEPDNKGMVVYCNFDRVVNSEKHHPKLQDSVSGCLVDPRGWSNPSSWWEACNGSLSLDLAVTWNPSETEQLPDGRFRTSKYASQINICRWFLDKQADSRFFSNMNQVFTKATFMRAGIPFSTTRLGPFVQIDGMSLFDKVLLHEMAHTWAGDQCDDIADPSWRNAWLPSYGWNSCKRLAARGNEGRNDAATRNADSIALFGLAATLIRNPNAPRTVNDNGTISPLPVANNQNNNPSTNPALNPNPKRDISDRLADTLYQASRAVSNGFKTSVIPRSLETSAAGAWTAKGVL